MTFSSIVIYWISETGAVSIDPVLCKLNGSLAEPSSVSFEMIFLGIVSATSWCTSVPEDLIISLLERPS